MRLHLEGMGLVGSLVAHWLAQHSVPFTWNDSDDRARQAWRASTGSIIPTGERDGSYEAYQEWWRWYGDERAPIWGIKPFMAEARFLYCSKHPPHDGAHYGLHRLGRVGQLNALAHKSLHLNVQAFVRDTQATFQSERCGPDGFGPKGPHADRVLVTHGFVPGRQKQYVWGWSVLVQIQAIDHSNQRACFYLRNGRVGDYLYPVPNETWHYGGSSRVVQAEPKPLSVGEKVDRWVERVRPRLEGVAHIQYTSMVEQGWRPVALPGQELLTRVPSENGGPERWYIRAQGSGGVRHWPILRAALVKSPLLEGI